MITKNPNTPNLDHALIPYTSPQFKDKISFDRAKSIQWKKEQVMVATKQSYSRERKMNCITKSLKILHFHQSSYFIQPFIQLNDQIFLDRTRGNQWKKE